MGRKCILGVILFLLSLTLTILHGSVVSKYIHNYQPSNQIKKVKIWQASEVKKEKYNLYQSSEEDLNNSQNLYNSQTVIHIKKTPRYNNISRSKPQPRHRVIDILWLLICSGLVFLMQPGFMCLESGLTRSKNNINVALKNLTDFGISIVCFWGFGFAFMFGTSAAGIIGYSNFLFTTNLQPFEATFFLFQAMFCGTATTIVSGAVAERMKFATYLFVALLVSGFIYPIFGHWAWNGMDTGVLIGWLGQRGFIDFAGSSVVHSIGGWVSLATLLVIGPRTGRFPRDRPAEKIHGSNLPLSVLGVMLIWFGWFGFNGGSTLALNGQVPDIIVNTIFASVAGMMTSLSIGWYIRGIPGVDLIINGTLAGLVAITGSCHAVTTLCAIVIGIVGAIVAILVEQALEKIRVDDAVGAIPVHLGAGIWGTLAVALFGKAEILDTSLNLTQQFTVQLLGVCTAFLLGFCVVYPVLLIANKFFLLRVSKKDEHIGLNISEHDAKTEILDLFEVMNSQASTQDLSLRVPVEPFTLVGQIAERYNQVMGALEEVTARNDAIVKVATDAIITFTKPGLEIISVNPSTEKIFYYKPQDLVGIPIYKILDFTINPLTMEKIDSDDLLTEAKNSIVKLLKLWVNPNLISSPSREIIDAYYRFDCQDIKPENLQFYFPSFIHLLEENLPDTQTCLETEKKINQKKYHTEIMMSKIAEIGNICELVGIRKDGSLFPIEIAIREAKFNQKRFYTGTFRDISERKESEVKLQENEQRFRILSRATFEGIIIYKQGKIVDANIAALQMFKYELSEMMGMNGWELIDSKYRNLVRENLSSGYEKPYEVVGLRKDGSIFPIEMEAKTFFYHGNQHRVSAIRDITERKLAEKALRESEEKFRSIMEQAADAFILLDLQGKIVDVNQTTCQSLGYTYEELLNLFIEDIEMNFALENFYQKWQKLIPGIPITLQGIHKRKDGKTFPVEVNLGLLKAGNGNLLLALCRDITDRKKAEQALLLEQEKSDKLLLNILPKPIAEKLKENQDIIAERFEEVTVLFADLVGFTELASSVHPERLVYLLNDIFSRFDLLVEKYGLEKIKTIGDAYMVVGGLPMPIENHAEAIALIAIDMVEELADFANRVKQNFPIRIGINTGPVVAGVIGRKKFIYDLWGDTVNIASRMESQGIPGVIQVTEVTYQILQHKFLFRERGIIDIKGKGYMKTYFLQGKKSYI